MDLLFTCPPGLEDIVELELRELFGNIKVERRVFGVKGRVLATVPEVSKIFNMRSIHHASIFLHNFPINKSKASLEIIYKEVKNLDLSPYLKKEKSFRITCERMGDHEFTSIDVQRVAGKAVVDAYGNKVDLENFDLEIKLDVINNYCLVGIALSKESLHKRGYRVFDHPAAIKPTIAYGMVRLSKPKEGNLFVDPMCGGGTILIEAALFNKKLKLYGFDINEKFLEGARRNALKAKVDINFSRLDCRNLSNYFKDIDRIVTNPPYGIRMEPSVGLTKLYHSFAEEAYKSMVEGGTLVTITLKYNLMKRALEKAGFKLLEERYVLHGDLWTKILIAEK